MFFHPFTEDELQKKAVEVIAAQKGQASTSTAEPDAAADADPEMAEGEEEEHLAEDAEVQDVD